MDNSFRTDQPPWRAFEEDLVEKYRQVGDPLADAAIRSVFDYENRGLDGVAALLNDILDAASLPITDTYGPGYRDFMTTTAELPDFFDDDEIESSARWFEQYGWTAFSILGCASLPEGYSVVEATEVLAATKEMNGHTQRRLWETIQFVIDVMDRDGIRRDTKLPSTASGTGVDRAQKVRLFHAVIRFFLTPRPDRLGAELEERTPYGERLLDYDWKPEYGTPINQAQLAATLLSFSYTILRGAANAWLHADRRGGEFVSLSMERDRNDPGCRHRSHGVDLRRRPRSLRTLAPPKSESRGPRAHGGVDAIRRRNRAALPSVPQADRADAGRAPDRRRTRGTGRP